MKVARGADVYDSDQRQTPLAGVVQIWERRGLLRLLIVRDVSLRYKRSVLGPSWTLLNPLLTMTALWLVFSRVFLVSAVGVPFAVYVLSGVVLMTFFQQAIATAGSSIVDSREVLSKVYVPAWAYALSAASAGAVNFMVSLVPLLVLQVVTGVGIPWTVLLLPLFCVPLLAFAAGCGLLVAAAAVRFYDVVDLTRVALFTAVYLTATFYPVSILSERARTAILLNPLYHYMVVFRGLVYEGRIPSTRSLVVVVGSAVVVSAVGMSVFVRSWRRLVVML